MRSASEPAAFEAEAERLKPYVPRLMIEWIRGSPAATFLARDGSLAFLDISGFTALTESLARRGKIGAELLRDILDGVFTSLLDEAYDWGAGLLKWGGDALLLLFDGPGHPERAARAAWEMQRTIDRVGRIRVAGASVTLRMSIGITSGPVEFFAAGSVHRELLVVGPVATEAVATEGIADAGEIVVSSALAGLLDPAYVGTPKAEGFLLQGPPSAVRGRPDEVSVEGVDVAACIPIAAREHVLAERGEPEHRVISATFVDLMHTDALLALHGPAAFAEALDERVSSIQETAARYEVPFNVTDVSKGSVKVLLTAGAPSSTGHDEEQTLRMARELSDRPGLIPIRIGIDTGRVFTGDFGPSYRRTYAVLGDAINTAARVMSRAEAGQILSTDVVLERSRTMFSTTPIEPFAAKGKAELVRASVVGAIVGRRGEREAETPLLGREDELAALLCVLDDVHAGNGWIVEISGAAGVGRSRLVHELIGRCGDLQVLQARCEEYEASTPYYVLRAPMRAALGLDMDADAAAVEGRLREVVAGIDDELVPFVPLLGILLGLDLPPTPETSSLDPRFLRDRLAAVAMRFLVETLGGTPTMFSVEDAHFMDEASADLLHRLMRAARSLRFALVVTHADPSRAWAPAGDEELCCFMLTLLPLSERSAVRIVESATDDRPLPPHVVEEIARRSGGNALFLFELIDMARASGTTDTLPDSVEAMLTAEIDRLSPSDRKVLRYASVLGASFDPGLLAAALSEETEFDDELLQRLRGLLDLDPAGRMRFRNTLVRDAAYEGLPFRRRRQLHARVAAAIEASAASLEAEAPTLVLHYSEAQRHERAWHYGRLAGDRALAIAAPVEAARFYELALAAAGRVRDVANRDRAAVWISLGDARETAGKFDASFEALRRATRLLADHPLEQARVHVLRARVRARTTSYPLALRETTSGLRLLDDREGASGVRGSLHAMRAEIRWFQGHPREAVALARLAIDDVVGTEEVESLMALARAYTALDGSYRMLGQPELARHEHLALEIYERLGQLRLVGIQALNLGTSAYWYGRWDEAADLYRRASDDLVRSGDRQNAAAAACNLGELLVGRGQLDEAERVLTEARRVLRAMGATPWVLFVETQLARCALERGDVDKAAEALGRIIEDARGVGYAASVLEMTVYYAQAEAMAGRADAGLAAIEQAAAAAGDEAALYVAPLERARSVCLRLLGRDDESRACLDAALAVAEAQGQPYEQLLARSSRAGVMVGMEKDEELREVLRLAQLLGITD
ncbi:MAG: AAA family ATPase [Gaiellaceae bacterium]